MVTPYVFDFSYPNFPFRRRLDRPLTLSIPVYNSERNLDHLADVKKPGRRRRVRDPLCLNVPFPSTFHSYLILDIILFVNSGSLLQVES